MKKLTPKVIVALSALTCIGIVIVLLNAINSENYSPSAFMRFTVILFSLAVIAVLFVYLSARAIKEPNISDISKKYLLITIPLTSFLLNTVATSFLLGSGIAMSGFGAAISAVAILIIVVASCLLFQSSVKKYFTNVKNGFVPTVSIILLLMPFISGSVVWGTQSVIEEKESRDADIVIAKCQKFFSDKASIEKIGPEELKPGDQSIEIDMILKLDIPAFVQINGNVVDGDKKIGYAHYSANLQRGIQNIKVPLKFDYGGYNLEKNWPENEKKSFVLKNTGIKLQNDSLCEIVGYIQVQEYTTRDYIKEDFIK